jgi:hypothetical protein
VKVKVEEKKGWRGVEGRGALPVFFGGDNKSLDLVPSTATIVSASSSSLSESIEIVSIAIGGEVRVMDGIGLIGFRGFFAAALRVCLAAVGLVAASLGALEDRLVTGILAKPPGGSWESIIEVN